MATKRRKYEWVYCGRCGGTGESWNPILGLFDGQCYGCNGTGEMKVLAPSEEK